MKNKIIPISLLLALGFSFSACSKKDLTVDPNNPADANSTVMMPGLISADIFMHESELARKAGMWARTFTGGDRQYVPYHTYSVTSGDFDNEWASVYSATLKQARIVQEKALKENKKTNRGIAFLIEAHAAGTAADLWGDVPFSQAADFEKYPTPKYDKQADVYAAVQVRLDSALKYLGSAAANAGAFNTSAGDWGQIIHSFKARYYLHVGDYANALAEAQLGINDPANSWMAIHTDSDPTTWNLYYQFIDYQRGGYMLANDAIAYELLDSTSTKYRGNAKTHEMARKLFYYTTADEGANDDCGYTYGEIDPDFCTGMFGWNAAFPLITYEETQLIIAEGQARAGADQAAIDALNLVRASHAATYSDVYDDYIVDDFDATGIAATAGLDRNQSILHEILEEKYLSLYGQIEIFTDLRRKGNIFRPTITPTTGANLPERFLYPQSEINSNPSIPSPLPGLFEKTPVNQ